MILGIEVRADRVTAVLVADGQVLHSATLAIDLLEERLDELCPRALRAGVRAVVLATDLVDELLAGEELLSPVGVVRLAEVEARWAPPFQGWPPELARRLGAPGRHLAPDPSETELDALAADFTARGFATLAVTAERSPWTPVAERDLGRRLLARLPDAALTLSHALGSLGLLPRENATIINAALIAPVGAWLDLRRAEIAAAGIDAPLYLCRYDGTLVGEEYARAHPIVTRGGRRAALARGAAVLAGVQDGWVVLGGDAPTAIGLLGGYARRSEAGADVHGIPTSLPGLEQHALPSPRYQGPDDDPRLLTAAQALTPSIALPVIALIGPPRVLTRGEGTRRRPLPALPLAEITALGAASAQVGGESGRIVDDDAPLGIAAVVEEARLLALASGAALDSLQVLETTSNAVAYAGPRAVRVTARVIGLPGLERNPACAP